MGFGWGLGEGKFVCPDHQNINFPGVFGQFIGFTVNIMVKWVLEGV